MSKKQLNATPRLVHVAACVDAHWFREGRHRFELGFLIGQTDLSAAGAQDTVVAAVEVPAEEPDLDHDVEIVQSFEDLSVDWVQEIAKQVDRLLPGGVHIVGLYVVTAVDAKPAIDQASVYLRAIASAVTIPVDFLDAKAAQAPHHHCIIHISTKTNTKSIQSFANLRDVARTAAVPAELRSPSTATDRLTMNKYVANVSIDEAISFSSLGSKTPSDAAGVHIAEKRLDELQQQLQPFVQRVWKARGVASASSPQQVELVASSSPEQDSATPTTKLPGHCRGVVQCVAFVPSSAPHAVQLATFYLKMDLVKSLLLRVELLLERLSDDGPVGSAVAALRDGGNVALPKRGLMKWYSGATQLDAGQQIQLSLHVFADDDALHAVQTALEILSAGDELSGVDIDAVATSLTWLESDSEQPVVVAPAGATSSASVSHPAATATPKASGSSLLFLVLPLLLLALAFIMQRSWS